MEAGGAGDSDGDAGEAGGGERRDEVTIKTHCCTHTPDT
jgi:hypothetical protein